MFHKQKKVFSLIFLLVFIFVPNVVYSKNKKKSSPEIKRLLQDISTSYSKIQSFQADFTQTKISKLLKNQAITHGSIVFKKPESLSIKFNKPYNINLFLKGKKVTKINNSDKTYSTISLKKQKSNIMNFLNISKTFEFLDKYFYIDKINTKSDLIYIICIPRKRKIKKKLKIVELWLNPNSLIFKKLKIEEPDNTLTEITIKNIKINKPISDNLFNFSKKGLEKQPWRQ